MTLGKEIARGGEGGVYEVDGHPTVLAKIYSREVSAEKAEKLAVMTQLAAPTLHAIAAWPTYSLYDKPRGKLKGFLMPRLSGYRELHELYSPAERKLAFPDADWSFLVHVARNVAAAINTIHEQGHIIGDINQKGILVLPKQGTVKLIDCDSFQIRTKQRLFLCEVGVRDFTPPELQGRSFHGLERTQSHDNFGLAVLCFQLLFMGRHPFAGRYHGPGEDSLERAIQECRFAYSQLAADKHMSPPPSTLPLASVSSTLGGLFERAFGEAAVRNGSRPTALAWMNALDELRHNVRICSNTPIHKYYAGLSTCPWCALEIGGVVFFVALSTRVTTERELPIAELWAKILTIPFPGSAPLPPVPPAHSLTPRPLPRNVRAARTWKHLQKWGASILCGIALVTASHVGPLLLLIAVVIAWWVFRTPANDFGEHAKRQEQLKEARRQWELLRVQWNQETREEPFSHKFQFLSDTHTEYEGLGKKYTQDRGRLESERYADQLRRFLNRHFLSRANIHGIGPGRTAMLRSFGIETAADITRNRVMQVPGFGLKRTEALMNWQKKIQTTFQFDPRQGVDPQVIAALDRQYATKRQELGTILLRGVGELEQIRQQIVQRRTQLWAAVEKAAHALAQAEADIRIL